MTSEQHYDVMQPYDIIASLSPISTCASNTYDKDQCQKAKRRDFLVRPHHRGVRESENKGKVQRDEYAWKMAVIPTIIH